MNPTRPSALSTNGVVATPHYLASQAGVRILQEGGSAVDAAVAANAVLQVVYPHNCSLGGDAFWIIYDPGEGHPVALNGSGRAPEAAQLERLRERGLTQMPLHGPLPVTVPGAVDSWHEALRRFGRLGLERVLAPAIAYAEDGFPATPKLCNAIARSAGLLALSPAAAAVLLPDGRVPRPGPRVRNPDPAAMETPVHRLLSKEYAAERRGDIDRRRAGPSRPPGHPQGGDTIYLCVVDRDGQCVSLIQSLYHSFGSGIMAPGTGVLLQNRGAYFSLRADHPNVIAPRKRTLHTLMPALMPRDGPPHLLCGPRGRDGHAPPHLQVV